MSPSTSGREPAWKEALSGLILQLSIDGKVCERSLLTAARDLIQRDKVFLKDLATSNWLLTFGIDGTAISGKRKFTHAILTLGAMYKKDTVALTELKCVTLAVAQHHDDACGLARIMHEKKLAVESTVGAVALALEIEQLYSKPSLTLHDGTTVRVGIKMCLDLAAARGMRGCRGKVACLCSCKGREGRQKLPGDGTIPAIEAGDSIDCWKTAEAVLQNACAFNSELMSAESLRAAAHLPPSSWDFTADGPWTCRHCSKVVWRSWTELEAERMHVAELRARADAGEVDASKALTSLLGKHADTHLDQLYLCAPVVHAGTDVFIVDPMHALELNVCKTAFKYSFLDKVNDVQREQVSAYFESMCIYFDIHAKGKRNPEQKWMSAADVDDYILGSLRCEKSKSPGLAVNTAVLADIVYGGKVASCTATADTAAAAHSTETPASARKPPSAVASRRSRKHPRQGFCAGSNASTGNAHHRRARSAWRP